MSKPRASYYCRYGDLIVSGTIGSDSPDALDELRTQVMRGFSEGMNYVADTEPLEGELADPGTIDTTKMPPVD